MKMELEVNSVSEAYHIIKGFRYKLTPEQVNTLLPILVKHLSYLERSMKYIKDKLNPSSRQLINEKIFSKVMDPYHSWTLNSITHQLKEVK